MISNLTNITKPEQFLAAANIGAGGIFYIGIVFMIWIIIMAITYLVTRSFEMAILTSSLIAFVGSILLVFAGLVAWTWALFFFAAMIFMFFYIGYTSGRTGA